MFSIMEDSHKKFNSLNKLKTRTKDNEKRKQEVLNNVGDIYNEFVTFTNVNTKKNRQIECKK